MKIDIQELKKLMKALKEGEVKEFEYEDNRIRLSFDDDDDNNDDNNDDNT